MEIKLPQAGQLRYSDREIMDEIGRTISVPWQIKG
jgi:hypothetical protein